MSKGGITATAIILGFRSAIFWSTIASSKDVFVFMHGFLRLGLLCYQIDVSLSAAYVYAVNLQYNHKFSTVMSKLFLCQCLFELLNNRCRPLEIFPVQWPTNHEPAHEYSFGFQKSWRYMPEMLKESCSVTKVKVC